MVTANDVARVRECEAEAAARIAALANGAEST